MKRFVVLLISLVVLLLPSIVNDLSVDKASAELAAIAAKYVK